MNTQMLIPEKIAVGYQKRSDTYTGKLAYVIYWDKKGVLRKETSWQSWRSKEIESDEYENKPMEGFVLNRGVGGVRQSYGWNTRNEYIRVYDPRGFEFEISVSNLLFILQECTSTKGKGLEGEFVYSWSGKELVLLPVACQEYQECVNFSDLQATKISARDLKVGCSYTTKRMKQLIYIGRYDYLNIPMGNAKKAHIFYDPEAVEQNKKYRNYDEFVTPAPTTALAKLDSEEQVANFAEIMDAFNSSQYAAKAKRFIVTPVNTELNPKTGYSEPNVIVSYGGDYIASSLRAETEWKDGKHIPLKELVQVSPQYEYSIVNGVIKREYSRRESNRWNTKPSSIFGMTPSPKSTHYHTIFHIDEVKKLERVKLEVELENGNKLDVTKIKFY